MFKPHIRLSHKKCYWTAKTDSIITVHLNMHIHIQLTERCHKSFRPLSCQTYTQPHQELVPQYWITMEKQEIAHAHLPISHARRWRLMGLHPTQYKQITRWQVLERK